MTGDDTSNSGADRWMFDHHEVLVDEDGYWWHVVNRFECVDSDTRHYRLEDGTHTADRWIHADDAEGVVGDPLFESAGWSTNTNPAHERGYRVNGILTEPANISRWLGNSCVSDYDCENCGESTDCAADIILDLSAKEVGAAWISCGACGEVTEIHGKPDRSLHTATDQDGDPP